MPFYSANCDDLAVLYDSFNDDRLGICWDFGHGRVQYEEGEGYLNELPKLGDRLISTHVHDNYYGNDIHCFPFLGMMKWEECMQILKDLNYKGDFTFEFVYDRIPDELLVDYMKLIYKTGEYLINL
jgi:sugar phosphate isomerase/epimerase